MKRRKKYKKLKSMPGVGKGWRLTVIGFHQYKSGVPLPLCRKYRCKEPELPVDIEYLIEESNKKQKEQGITWTEDHS